MYCCLLVYRHNYIYLINLILFDMCNYEMNYYDININIRIYIFDT